MINKKLLDEIKEYCNLNNLNYKQFINELLQNAFFIKKYGNSPFKTKKTENEKNNIEIDKIDKPQEKVIEKKNRIQIIKK